MRSSLLTACCVLLFFSVRLTAQHISNPFFAIPPDRPGVVESGAADLRFQADFISLDNALRQAPHESSNRVATIDLPSADGKIQSFSIHQTDVMHPALGSKYPDIRTYAGASMDGSGDLLAITCSPYAGFLAIILRPDGSRWYLEPVQQGLASVYTLYSSHQLHQHAAHGHCGVDDHLIPSDLTVVDAGGAAQQRGNVTPMPIRIYRFACAATGGFTQDNGGTVASGLAAVVDKVNKINVPIQRDVSVRLQLVPQNDQLIFLDDATDPYTGFNLGAWITENQLVLNSTIGSGAYDLGHVIGRGTGSGVIGLASLSSACSALNKGRGASSGTSYGDFFIGTFAHEVGHQLSATHTYNYCPPNDVTGSTAFEPASGSTIMSYGGVCGMQNIINTTDLYYHIASIQQMRTFTTVNGGSTCGNLQATANNSPEALVLSVADRSIPIRTPFELKGSGTDVDGDNLTYCWEQYDLGQSVELGAEGNDAPLFRSFQPTTNPNRTFPRINDIASNTSNPREILPTRTRNLNFRLTVRDNSPLSGGIDWAPLRLFVTDQAGPFSVISPNSAGITWSQSAYTLVRWDVSNTNNPPVNCRKVNIRLSADGGLTYPFTLASNVENNGNAYVQVPPSLNTSQARIRVEAADNVFFDISNANFTIAPAQSPAYTVGIGTTAAQACAPANLSIDVFSSGLAGFNTPITLSVLSGLPPGANATFNPSEIIPGQTAVLTLDLSAVSADGPYTLVVLADAGGSTSSLSVNLDLVTNNFDNLALLSPANGAGGAPQTPFLRWNPVNDADTYEMQLARNPSFAPSDIVETRTNLSNDSIQVGTILPKGNLYYWRIRPRNACGAGAWTEPFAFATAVDQCNTYTAGDLPKNITAASPVTIESTINIPAGSIVSDVNVKKVQGFHEFFAHLDVRLRSPLGQEVTLFNASCGTYNGGFNFGFDDAATATFPCPPPNNGNIFKPKSDLAAFNGTNGGGAWVLRVRDNIAGSGGQIAAFILEVCSSTSLNAPQIVTNNPLSLPSGNNAAITASFLNAEDTNNGPSQLTYTLMSLPAYGRLEKSGVALALGGQFSQADINNGDLRFFDFGNNPFGVDNFLFSVTDNEGGLAAGRFIIQPVSSTTQPSLGNLPFTLNPNPTSGLVQVVLPQDYDQAVRVSVHALNGQLILERSYDRGNAAVWLDLSDTPNGLYTIFLRASDGFGVRKLVLKK
jgi:subtilisin-like proprotein convertase family protein